MGKRAARDWNVAREGGSCMGEWWSVWRGRARDEWTWRGKG